MAQSFTTKKQNFLSRYSAQIIALLAANDALVGLHAEFVAETYGNGGANQLTDADVQGVLPAGTAALAWAADANIVTVTGAVSTARTALEAMRP